MRGRKSMLALAVAVLLAACGSSTVSAGQYVKSICTAVGPFERDVNNRSSALNLATISSAAQGKKALHDFLSAAANDTGTALSKVKGAGTPDVNKGKAIADAINKAFARLKAVLDRAVSQSNSLPTTSPQAFRAGALNLGSSVRSSMASIDSSLSGLRNAQLESAASREPACQRLGA